MTLLVCFWRMENIDLSLVPLFPIQGDIVHECLLQ